MHIQSILYTVLKLDGAKLLNNAQLPKSGVFEWTFRVIRNLCANTLLNLLLFIKFAHNFILSNYLTLFSLTFCNITSHLGFLEHFFMVQHFIFYLNCILIHKRCLTYTCVFYWSGKTVLELIIWEKKVLFVHMWHFFLSCYLSNV